MSKPDYVRKHFASLKAKTLKNALAQRIAQDFPRIGGRRIQLLCAEMILEVLENHLRPREHLSHGQVLWMAVPVDHPPRRHQRIADTPLVPVILDLSTPEDIDRRFKRESSSERLLQKALRLCRQAHEQSGLLSNSDLAELLGASHSRIGSVLAAYERKTGRIVPRRATIHDVGTATTHKRIICYKHYAEGKSADQVARETCHSLEAVDRYLSQYDRVRHCRLRNSVRKRPLTSSTAPSRSSVNTLRSTRR
jgi:hypothetical protein